MDRMLGVVKDMEVMITIKVTMAMTIQGIQTMTTVDIIIKAGVTMDMVVMDRVMATTDMMDLVTITVAGMDNSKVVSNLFLYLFNLHSLKLVLLFFASLN